MHPSRGEYGGNNGSDAKDRDNEGYGEIIGVEDKGGDGDREGNLDKDRDAERVIRDKNRYGNGKGDRGHYNIAKLN